MGRPGCHRNGFCTDVGAFYPDTDSVTSLLRPRLERSKHRAGRGAGGRIRAPRPRDVTLQIASGAEASEAPFHVVAGDGLSKFDRVVAAAYEHADTGRMGCSVDRDQPAAWRTARVSRRCIASRSATVPSATDLGTDRPAACPGTNSLVADCITRT